MNTAIRRESHGGNIHGELEFMLFQKKIAAWTAMKPVVGGGFVQFDPID
ncbi:MAG: hypothetical protein KDC54_16660 [Lewinella sp.]|nr:hypothetical protein [Lewinella sp.]